MSTVALRNNLNSLFPSISHERQALDLRDQVSQTGGGEARVGGGAAQPKHGSYRPLVDLNGKGMVFKWATKLQKQNSPNPKISEVKGIFETI